MRGWANAGPRFVSCPPGMLDAPQDLPGPLRPLLASPQRLRSLASPPAPPRPRASSWLRLWGWQGRLNILEAALPHPPDQPGPRSAVLECRACLGPARGLRRPQGPLRGRGCSLGGRGWGCSAWRAGSWVEDGEGPGARRLAAEHEEARSAPAWEDGQGGWRRGKTAAQAGGWAGESPDHVWARIGAAG